MLFHGYLHVRVGTSSQIKSNLIIITEMSVVFVYYASQSGDSVYFVCDLYIFTYVQV